MLTEIPTGYSHSDTLKRRQSHAGKETERATGMRRKEITVTVMIA